ncbi:MAG: DUF1636 domain-containing protein [Pseudomonadota bacterium]
MTTWITVCDSCKRENWAETAQSETDGERFAAMVEAAVQEVTGVETRRHSCLMGCARACNVAIQGDGKLNYTLGAFDPTQEVADAVVEYARLHATSDTGQVPYRNWPQAIKGHFVTRHPPLPSTD